MYDTNKTNFYPFFDPYIAGGRLGYGSKLLISLCVGCFYSLLQYAALENKIVFFSENCWILGLIISTSCFSLYIATDVLRGNIQDMREIEGKETASLNLINEWMNDRRLLLAGFGFATATASIGHILGVPAEFYESTATLAIIYFGFFVAGFSSGMGLLAIAAVIALYLKFAPNLHHSLDPNNPDGNGGLKKLGDSLWYFSGLVGAVGILISIHLSGVSWAYMDKPFVQLVFLFWLSFPYVIAVSIVLIPGLAVRRQVSYYKQYSINQLKQEKAKLYSDYKQFDPKDDEEIISEKKKLGERLEQIQSDIERLEKMRTSPIDGKYLG